jgi:hypothetical protein
VLRSILMRRVAPSAIVFAMAVAGVAYAGSPEDDGNRIVAPSEYLEDIETPGDTGGVMDEVDSGAAQAEAAEAAAKKAADGKKAAADDEGGW